MKKIKESKTKKQEEQSSENVNVWDKAIEVESNHYNWDGEPVVKAARNKSKKTKLLHIDLFSGCGGLG